MTNAHQSRKRRKERGESANNSCKRRESGERGGGGQKTAMEWVDGVYDTLVGGKERKGLTHRESKDDASTIQTTSVTLEAKE